jgi:hypothetical protein
LSQITAITPVPLFSGVKLFGDYDSFAMVDLQLGTVLEIDTFLGLTPGTTKYPADVGGNIFAMRGQWLGDSPTAVETQYMALTTFAGIAATFRRPTGGIYPGNAWREHNCYFTVSDLSVGTIQQLGINWYGMTYSLVLRQVAKA